VIILVLTRGLSIQQEAEAEEEKLDQKEEIELISYNNEDDEVLTEARIYRSLKKR
jgi:hypothetical protein